jgi:hypothetical protein
MCGNWIQSRFRRISIPNEIFSHSAVTFLEKHKISGQVTFWQLTRLLIQPTWKIFLFSSFFKWIMTGVTHLNAYLIGRTLTSCESVDDASSNFMLFGPILIIFLKIAKNIFDDHLSDCDYQVADIMQRFVMTLIYKKVSF